MPAKIESKVARPSISSVALLPFVKGSLARRSNGTSTVNGVPVSSSPWASAA
jgi:hypothetical protein